MFRPLEMHHNFEHLSEPLLMQQVAPVSMWLMSICIAPTIMKIAT